MVFGADIIAGFPTETDEMFENSLRFVTEAELTYLHVFPYSPRQGTPAARMPQVERSIAKARAAKLRALGESQFEKLAASRVGQIESVLVERDGLGRTEQFIPVAVSDTAPGQIVPVKVMKASADGLVGELFRTAA
jgi:threonylcarbamoyladenosine tRNA methylthiotransferase MtaB